MMIPDVTLYGVYTPGYEGPHAQFREQTDAEEWGEKKYGQGNFEIMLNWSRWSTEEEKKEIADFYANTSK